MLSGAIVLPPVTGRDLHIHIGRNAANGGKLSYQRFFIKAVGNFRSERDLM
jgi:hypothetical protein